MKVRTIEEAWAKANEIFPTDYMKDDESSQRAGYPIYRSTVEGHFNDCICDLNDRLEVNIADGNQSINIWIQSKEELPELPAKEEIKEAASHQYTFEPKQVQLVRIFVMGYQFESKANQVVYKAMRNSEHFWQWQIASDMVEAYCADKGIEWGTIRIISVNHYPKGETEGHYVIEAIIGAKAKS